MSKGSSKPGQSDDEPKYVPPMVELGLIVAALALAAGAIFFLVSKFRDRAEDAQFAEQTGAQKLRSAGPWGLAQEPFRNVKLNGFHNVWDKDRDFTLWFDDVPQEVQNRSVATTEHSNIRPSDYVGSEKCVECHESKYRDWHGHSHRRMNAMATPENVLGDFSGEATINYLGGIGRFYQHNSKPRMELKRGPITRIYEIERTIGSRFFQYYIGQLVEGSDSKDLAAWKTQHVLPFGYWIDERQWVPTVHVFRETDTDSVSEDPFTETGIVPYDASCISCHTTIAAGDWMLNIAGGQRISAFSPRSVSFHAGGYLAEARPRLLGGGDISSVPDHGIFDIGRYMAEFPKENVTSLGVNCEACHFGTRKHVEQSTKTTSDYLPKFFPAGPHVFAEGENVEDVLGRTPHNANFACAKCHSGGRPRFANGSDTWNSTEYSDAVRGFCYDPVKAEHEKKNFLTCVHCHDPHQATGPKWQRTAVEDSQSCLECHQQFADTANLANHTHHSADSTGSHCMNCHMPKINEGLQKVVRTHQIFNPTDTGMIEANQPNACNLCHLDKPIDWTIDHLRDWYGEEHEYRETELAENYPNRTEAVGLGWLKSPHAPTRLAAAEALAESEFDWVVPPLLELMATDEHLVNRQFTQKRLEERLNYDFDTNGYTFFMTAAERAKAISRLRPILSKQ